MRETPFVSRVAQLIIHSQILIYKIYIHTQKKIALDFMPIENAHFPSKRKTMRIG